MFKVSFEEELDALRKSGLTEEQVKAIWTLVIRVSATMAGLEYKESEAND